MKKKTNHIKFVETRYLRRKNRTNTIAKINSELPRMIINKSNKFNYAMVIDSEGNVLLNLNDKNASWNKVEKAFGLGKQVAEKLLSQKIEKVVFDRNGNLYHGRAKSIADGAREWWLKI